MTFPALLRKLLPLASTGRFPRLASLCSQAPSLALWLASAIPARFPPLALLLAPSQAPLRLSELSRVHLLPHFPAPWQEWSVGFPWLVLPHLLGLLPVRLQALWLASSRAQVCFLWLVLLHLLGLSPARL